MPASSPHAENRSAGLIRHISPTSAWAVSLGTIVGWGMLVLTCSTYLQQAGPVGSIAGLLLGLVSMLVIAASYHYLMQGHQGSGGAYAFARDLFGFDHGALVAWFLILTYLALLWANATSLPLFARTFCGNLFEFGLHYQFLGYDVYVGEALLSMVAIILTGLACIRCGKRASHAMTAMAAIIVVGITICFVAIMARHGSSGFSFEPLYAPVTSHLRQILGIACISTWAFIGFESITYSTGELSFSSRHAFKILAAALITAMLLYAFTMLISISAYPKPYDSWLAYIDNLSYARGLSTIPAFYAVNHFMGSAGVGILTAVLLCLIITSLFGCTFALSRLIYALGCDEVIPSWFAVTNEYGSPYRAICSVIAASLFIPLLGRTANGLIVDVSTLSATFIYGFVSACAIRDGKLQDNRREVTCGVVGLAIMAVVGIFLLFTAVTSSDTLATESHIVFLVWSNLGFFVFHWLLKKDTKGMYGTSTVAWMILLAMTLCMSAIWMANMGVAATDKAYADIMLYESGQLSTIGDMPSKQIFFKQVFQEVNLKIGKGAIIIAIMCMVSFSVIISNLSIVRRREEASRLREHEALKVANTDPLTGMFSKHAYLEQEAKLNALIQEGSLDELGIVVCDVNDLKRVNDTQGHEAGDRLILLASKLISRYFKHSPVYRIGGDEFVVVLQGRDYLDRERIIARLQARTQTNKRKGKVVVATGLAVLQLPEDHEVHDVFNRADALMYENKRTLKNPGEEIR